MMRNVPLFLALSGAVLIMALSVAGCLSDDQEGDADTDAAAAASDQVASEGDAPAAGYVIQQPFDLSIVFTSPVFNDTRRIPKRSTCTAISANEPNISPALAWEGLPEGTVSLALTMDSLEVEGGPRVHWVMWNMPPSLTELTEGIAQADVLPDGTAQGANGAGGVGYLGPCPPVMVSTFGQQGSMGETKKRDIEKYFFKLYALDVQLDLPPSTTKDDLLKAMDGHILAAGELVGERQGEISRREH
jgi:Raf kinase inhibitor-like YbhB/YbcL family protein